jgi:hypothetical protein
MKMHAQETDIFLRIHFYCIFLRLCRRNRSTSYKARHTSDTTLYEEKLPLALHYISGVQILQNLGGTSKSQVP